MNIGMHCVCLECSMYCDMQYMHIGVQYLQQHAVCTAACSMHSSVQYAQRYAVCTHCTAVCSMYSDLQYAQRRVVCATNYQASLYRRSSHLPARKRETKERPLRLSLRLSPRLHPDYLMRQSKILTLYQLLCHYFICEASSILPSP